MPPPPLLFFGFGGRSSCGPDGALAGAPVGSTGVSPFTRAAIRLGFSLRRKSGSSASASPTLLLTPPLRWASRTKPSSLSAAESIVWSPFVVIFSPAGPPPSRPARPSSRPGAPPRWRGRRCRRRDPSRALSEALAFVCQASGRLNQWTVRQPPGPRVRLLDLRGEPEEQRLAGGRPDQLDADGQAVDDAEGNHRRRLPGHVDDRRERRELAAAAELLPWVLGFEHPADRHRQLREAGRQHDVDVVPEPRDTPGESLQTEDALRVDDARRLVRGRGQRPVQRLELRRVVGGKERRPDLPELREHAEQHVVDPRRRRFDDLVAERAERV